MFVGQPPRMLFQELDFDLTAPEACFQAGSAEECFLTLNAWRQAQIEHENITISLAVKALCHENMGNNLDHFFATLSVLNMFTIVSGKLFLFGSPKREHGPDKMFLFQHYMQLFSK